MFIVSFYSYKGGVGRTATLLNTAWFMAMRGRRIALLDLDLEAPGLSFASLKDPESSYPEADRASKQGFCELATYFQKHQDFPQGWNQDYLHEGLGPAGRLALMAAGDRSDAAAYESRLHQFSWYDFYMEHQGDRFMTRLAYALAYLGYEYLFIDARTGLTDVAFISTIHLPDLVVLLTNLTEQSIDGIRQRIESIEECNRECAGEGSRQRKPGYAKTPIEIVVAASPMPRGEWARRNERIKQVRDKLGRPVDVEIDYLDLLAVGEEDQILFRRMNRDDLLADAFLAGATQAYQRLADEISRRNPESPENLIENGRRLWEVGLWRVSKAHFDEARERVEKHAARAARYVSLPEDAGNNPIWQEARLGWLLADLDALDPEGAEAELENLGDSTRKPIRIERARLWLALAFRYILLNRFVDSAKAASKARAELQNLCHGDAYDGHLEDLLALASLREGYAWMLANRWQAAETQTEEACRIYRKLAARPLLLSLAQCQLARIKLARGVAAVGAIDDGLHEVGACLAGSSGDAPPSLAAATILSQHVAADFHHAKGLSLYEQGQGGAARRSLQRALELFGEDKDAVGESDLNALRCSLFVDDSPASAQEWPALIASAIGLRIPAAAYRLALARWSGLIATRVCDASAEGAVSAIAAELSKALRPLGSGWNGAMDGLPGHPETYTSALLAVSPENLEKWRFDPALPALIALERVRFLLNRAGDDGHGRAALAEAQTIWKQVCAYRDAAQAEATPGAAQAGTMPDAAPPEIDPELQHPLLLLEGILSLARGDRAQKTSRDLAQRLATAAADRQHAGYLLRAAQLLLVPALLDPDRYAAMLERFIAACGSEAASAATQAADASQPASRFSQQWPWTLPVAFVAHSRNPHLRQAWQALVRRGLPLWPAQEQARRAS